MRIDFHGWILSDAAQEIDNIVGRIRMRGEAEQVTFVTGVGEHKKQVLELLKMYGIEAHEMIGNAGCVVAQVE